MVKAGIESGRKRDRKGMACTLPVPGIGLVDGRTRQARLYGQAVADITADLGGEAAISRAELELVRRAAGLGVLATMAESRLLNGEPVDIAELCGIGNAQRRLLATLGLQRRAVDVTPSISAWARNRPTLPAGEDSDTQAGDVP